MLTDVGKALVEQRFRDPEANPHASVAWEDAKRRLMAPFNLKKGVAATQRRKGAKTQGLRFLDSFTRWVSDSSTSFPSYLPALCALAFWRPPSAVLLRRTGLCVNWLSWVQAVSSRGRPTLPALPGSLDLERRLPMYQGLRKRWLPAFPRFAPLSACRAEPHLGSPLAKRREFGSSDCVNSKTLARLLGHRRRPHRPRHLGWSQTDPLALPRACCGQSLPGQVLRRPAPTPRHRPTPVPWTL